MATFVAYSASSNILGRSALLSYKVYTVEKHYCKKTLVRFYCISDWIWFRFL